MQSSSMHRSPSCFHVMIWLHNAAFYLHAPEHASADVQGSADYADELDHSHTRRGYIEFVREEAAKKENVAKDCRNLYIWNSVNFFWLRKVVLLLRFLQKRPVSGRCKETWRA